MALISTRRALLGGLRGLDAILWLLRDEFWDTRAAPVNGTPATPGPGTRVVVDTDGDGISVGSGVLALANPNTAYGDPALWLTQDGGGGIVRAAGRTMIARITNPDVTYRWYVGWDVNTSGAFLDGAYMCSVSDQLRVQEAAGFVVVASMTDGATYTIAIVLRATGAYYFVRGGAFTNWTLLYIGALANSTPLYPGIMTYNAPTAACDFARVPVATYLPPLLAYDTFTR